MRISQGQTLRMAVIGLMTGPLAAALNAQPPGPPGPPGPPPHGGPGGGMGMLLRSEEVREELALSQDQMMQLREIGEEFRRRFEDRKRGRRGEGRRGPRGPEAEGRRGPPRGERGEPREGRGRPSEEMRERMRELQQEVEGRLGEILDDDQMKRLREITVQAQMEHAGPMALLHGKLGESLGISEEQREQIHDRAKELRKEAGEQMRELRKAHHQELLGVLTSEQLAQLDEMTGEPFDLPEPPHWGEGRRGGRGFDGRPPRPERGEGKRGRRGSGRKPAGDEGIE